ncbi:MAG: hypothetical protein CVU44_20395 [Chloroflexi bacterium HGW-Chloroflexi-6]|nr:MAG: hypothetical protein CVU44_20395 [Chloroflexi bacterium HGW-Chloroflexi-6]
MSAKKVVFIVLCVVLGLVPLFLNPFRYDLPVGYAGMFASFGKQLADANFRLPVYALGDVPYVYPPLGFYIMAVFLKLGISDWLYLRFMPALFSLVALLAFFKIYDHFYKSKVAAGLALLLLAASPYLIESNVWAAGIVRGLAFAFFGLAFYAFLQLKTDSNWKLPALTGILSGLTILSHPGYAFFLALWMGIWFLFHFKIWRKVPIVLLFALATIGPWLIAVLLHHPFDVFIHALGSHGTLGVFSILQNPLNLIGLIQLGVSKLFQIPLLGWLAAIGLAYHLYRKRFELPVLFAASLLFGLESRRFIVILGVLMAVGVMQDFYQAFSARKYWNAASFLAVLALVAVIFGVGVQRIGAVKPSLTRLYIEAAEYLRQNSIAGEQYLIYADYQEAEWFPYFSERTPIFAHWAHEWQGNLGEQADLLYENFDCGLKGDLNCIEDVIRRAGKQPGYMIIMKNKYRDLIDRLSTGSEWKRVYNNREYQVWKKVTP